MVSTTLLNLFVGSFTLLNITRTQNGVTIADQTYGENPAGVISYVPSGFMSAVLQTTDSSLRPLDLTLPARDNQTDAEWADVGRHTLAYAGPFSFVENNHTGSNAQHQDDSSMKNGTVIHGPLLTSTLPAFVGSLQRRDFLFSEDGMYLNLVGNLGGGVVDNLWWKRLERDVRFD